MDKANTVPNLVKVKAQKRSLSSSFKQQVERQSADGISEDECSNEDDSNLLKYIDASLSFTIGAQPQDHTGIQICIQLGKEEYGSHNERKRATKLNTENHFEVLIR